MADAKLFAGHRIKRIRRQASLTQAAMADMLDISPSYLNLIERNQRPLSATLLLRLAERFDFDPRSLSDDEPGGGEAGLRRRLVDPLFAAPGALENACSIHVGFGQSPRAFAKRFAEAKEPFEAVAGCGR